MDLAARYQINSRDASLKKMNHAFSRSDLITKPSTLALGFTKKQRGALPRLILQEFTLEAQRADVVVDASFNLSLMMKNRRN